MCLEEALLEKVVLVPGQVASPHRHGADVFVYVLEGTIVKQLKGGLSSPTDVHSGSRNASSVEPATLLVFFLKKTGAARRFRCRQSTGLIKPVEKRETTEFWR